MSLKFSSRVIHFFLRSHSFLFNNLERLADIDESGHSMIDVVRCMRCRYLYTNTRLAFGNHWIAKAYDIYATRCAINITTIIVKLKCNAKRNNNSTYKAFGRRKWRRDEHRPASLGKLDDFHRRL